MGDIFLELCVYSYSVNILLWLELCRWIHLLIGRSVCAIVSLSIMWNVRFPHIISMYRPMIWSRPSILYRPTLTDSKPIAKAPVG